MARRDAKAAGRHAANCKPPLFELDAWNAVVRNLHLSPQQERIVGLLLQGKRDKQMAQELGLSVPTIRTYLGRIFLRVGVKDRIELILRVFAAANGAGAAKDRHPSR